MAHQRASGCVRLGRMIRAARRHRGLTQQEVAALLQANPPHIVSGDYTRARIAQWEGAHRRILPRDLHMLAKALNVELEGVNEQAHSPHNPERYCSADLLAVPRITCRSTGNVIWPESEQ